MLPQPPTFRSHRWLVRLLLGMLLLYAAFILWPAFESGLATFEGDPKFDWHQPYDVWYLREAVTSPGLLDWAGAIAALASIPAAFFAVPLGVIALASTRALWGELPSRARLISCATGLLAIAIPLLTIHAAGQFLRYLTD